MCHILSYHDDHSCILHIFIYPFVGCWWGRGALATRGICNIGKINYYLGKRGAQVGRDTLYPDIDWCKYPEATCGHAKGEQIRWSECIDELFRTRKTQ